MAYLEGQATVLGLQVLTHSHMGLGLHFGAHQPKGIRHLSSVFGSICEFNG